MSDLSKFLFSYVGGPYRTHMPLWSEGLISAELIPYSSKVGYTTTLQSVPTSCSRRSIFSFFSISVWDLIISNLFLRPLSVLILHLKRFKFTRSNAVKKIRKPIILSRELMVREEFTATKHVRKFEMRTHIKEQVAEIMYRCMTLKFI